MWWQWEFGFGGEFKENIVELRRQIFEREKISCVFCVVHLLFLELQVKDMSLREIRMQFKTSKVHQLYFHCVIRT